MKKAFLAILFLGLMITPLLIAQEGEGETVEMPETTTFYFGGHLDGDMLMVESMARFESRAPLGTVAGMIQGVTGEVTIWLDSIMLVQVEAPEPEDEQLNEIEEAQPAEGESEVVDSLEAEAGVEDVEPEMAEEPAAEEMTEAMAEEEPAQQQVPVPAGYNRPIATFEIPLGNLMTGSTARDEMFRAGEYMDVNNYPVATFQLTSIQDPSMYSLEENNEVSLIASGDLTIKDSTQRINNIQVYMNYIKESPVTAENAKLPGDILHFTAEFSFKLSDFGIGIEMDNLLLLDDKVTVSFDGFGSTSPFTAATTEE